VVAPGASWTGRAVNLSTGGAFITGGPELDVGRRLSVTIDLCDHKPPIEAHAKVVWTRAFSGGDEHAGMGVRFVRIDDDAEKRLEHLVAFHKVTPREIVHEAVRVQLPGLPARLRAHARETTSHMLVLEAELGWLEIGGEVITEIAPGDVRTGRLTWVGVEMAPSGKARLCLNVELQPDADLSLPDEALLADDEPEEDTQPGVQPGDPHRGISRHN